MANINNKPQILQLQDFLNNHFDFRVNMYSLDREYRKKSDFTSSWLPMDDMAFRSIKYFCKENNWKNFTSDLEDILFSDRVKQWFPITEYFAELENDTQIDWIDRLASCLLLKEPTKLINKKPLSSLVSLLLKKWLIACVHCSQGKKPNDVMLLLISDQGKYKTSFLNYLCPGPLKDFIVTSHINPNLTDNNTANFLAEKFLINVDDQMENIFGKDFNNMKAIISAPDVTNRKAYARFTKKRKRIANFMGSVNNPNFLTDSQNRRYLCFELAEIKPEYNKIDINLVWAQAYSLSDNIKPFEVFSSEDRAAIEEINKTLTAPTVEQEFLEQTFYPVHGFDEDRFTIYLTISELLHIIREISGFNNVKTQRLQIALSRLNFVKESKRLIRTNDSSRYVYKMKVYSEASRNLSKCGIDVSQYYNILESEKNQQSLKVSI